jgi:hypothetical protein
MRFLLVSMHSCGCDQLTCKVASIVKPLHMEQRSGSRYVCVSRTRSISLFCFSCASFPCFRFVCAQLLLCIPLFKHVGPETPPEKHPLPALIYGCRICSFLHARGLFANVRGSWCAHSSDSRMKTQHCKKKAVTRIWRLHG